MEYDSIFLVGPMGSGKTTVGQALARRLNLEFADCDHEIEEHTGASVALIFDIEGETGFRERETAMLDDLTKVKGLVLATGGGAVLDEDNRKHLMQRGQVIYLHASVEQLYQRTCRDRKRPLLQTDNPKQRIEELFTARDPLYREVADLIIETGSRTVGKVVQNILNQLDSTE